MRSISRSIFRGGSIAAGSRRARRRGRRPWWARTSATTFCALRSRKSDRRDSPMAASCVRSARGGMTARHPIFTPRTNSWNAWLPYATPADQIWCRRAGSSQCGWWPRRSPTAARDRGMHGAAVLLRDEWIAVAPGTARAPSFGFGARRYSSRMPSRMVCRVAARQDRDRDDGADGDAEARRRRVAVDLRCTFTVASASFTSERTIANVMSTRPRGALLVRVAS